MERRGIEYSEPWGHPILSSEANSGVLRGHHFQYDPSHPLGQHVLMPITPGEHQHAPSIADPVLCAVPDDANCTCCLQSHADAITGQKTPQAVVIAIAARPLHKVNEPRATTVIQAP